MQGGDRLTFRFDAITQGAAWSQTPPPSLSDLSQPVRSMAIELLGPSLAAEVGSHASNLVIDDKRAERQERRLLVRTALRDMGIHLREDEPIAVGLRQLVYAAMGDARVEGADDTGLHDAIPPNVIPCLVERCDVVTCVCSLSDLSPRWAHSVAVNLEVYTPSGGKCDDIPLAVRRAVGGVMAVIVAVSRIAARVHGARTSSKDFNKMVGVLEQSTKATATEIVEQVASDSGMVSAVLSMIIFDEDSVSTRRFDLIDSLNGRSAAIAAIYIAERLTPWFWSTPMALLSFAYALASTSCTGERWTRAPLCEMVVLASRVEMGCVKK